MIFQHLVINFSNPNIPLQIQLTSIFINYLSDSRFLQFSWIKKPRKRYPFSLFSYGFSELQKREKKLVEAILRAMVVRGWFCYVFSFLLYFFYLFFLIYGNSKWVAWRFRDAATYNGIDHASGMWEGGLVLLWVPLWLIGFFSVRKRFFIEL